MLEKTLESPLDYKEIKSGNPKGNQSWIFIGRTDAEAEAPILWPPDIKSWLTGKDPDAGKDWRQEEKGMTENETAGWHHRLNGHESEQTPGDGEGEGSMVCCSPWGRKSQTWLGDWTATKNDIVGQHHWLDRMSLSKLQELVMDREARHATVLRVTKSWTQLSDWTELNWYIPNLSQSIGVDILPLK